MSTQSSIPSGLLTINSRKQKALSSLPSLIEIRNERCRRDPLYWAQNWTQTENPHYLQQGLEFRAHFPKKDYFRPLFDALKCETRLFVPKSREMMTSWCAMVYATHAA